MLNLTPAQLKARLEAAEEDPLLLDIREPWEFKRAHIRGSTLVPMREMTWTMDSLDPERETVVICHNGVRSRCVARALEQAGFQQVINLAGGLDAWAREVDKDMAVY